MINNLVEFTFIYTVGIDRCIAAIIPFFRERKPAVISSEIVVEIRPTKAEKSGSINYTIKLSLYIPTKLK